jgi:hypothetical protein
LPKQESLLQKIFTDQPTFLARKASNHSQTLANHWLKISLTFWRRKKQTQHIFIHSFVPSVESGKAERSGAENEPRDFSLTFFDTKKEAKKYSPLQGLPAGGGCKQIIAARRRLFELTSIAGHAMIFQWLAHPAL